MDLTDSIKRQLNNSQQEKHRILKTLRKLLIWGLVVHHDMDIQEVEDQ